MPTPAELAQSHTDLKPEELEHLQRLLGSWGVLADLSFSDLLLLVPVHAHATIGNGNAHSLGLGPGQGDGAGPHDGEATDPELVVLGQMRPNNRPTLVDQDLVGQTVNESQWALVARCLHTGEIVRGSIHHPILGEQVPVENIPVRFEDRIVATLLRVSLAPLKGPTSMYERTYLDVFERLADMVAQSAFPFPDEDVGTEEAPRVGDGVVVVDADGRVEFASPNAMNAFHRMGIYTQPEGRRFGDLDIEESAVEWALATGRPVVEEVERRPDVIVLVHCVPLLSHGVVTGAMILLRDVTDVRRLDRLLLSKDAAIREVHHRVKNNLQTISSLLSLQARRVGDRAARVALHEAERRVRSIALVHEILSRDPSDQVPFAEIVASLVQMAEDSVVSSQPIVISVHGDLGEVAADVATPLAVAVAELLQNAVEHAFDPEAAGGNDGAAGLEGAGGAAGYAPVGHVDLTLAPGEDALEIEVRDDGLGLPEGFDIEQTTSLGLLIVRDLVVSQLEGTISMASLPPSQGGGTRVAISVPQRAPH
ncbi:MAG TPA: histidine kinase N-terminal domain-containing protein [Acidimicrobiales bacterium]|jgi:two-component sensor histidine kinase|nr:histidine kinase N-terminal domain-containing protein [Acidimicrobiales bacterium]